MRHLIKAGAYWAHTAQVALRFDENSQNKDYHQRYGLADRRHQTPQCT
jgi:hypothetical protein